MRSPLPYRAVTWMYWEWDQEEKAIKLFSLLYSALNIDKAFAVRMEEKNTVQWNIICYDFSPWVNFTPGWNQGALFGVIESFLFQMQGLQWVNFEPFSTLLSLVITPAEKCKCVWCLWEHLNGLDGSIKRVNLDINVAWRVWNKWVWITAWVMDT